MKLSLDCEPADTNRAIRAANRLVEVCRANPRLIIEDTAFFDFEGGLNCRASGTEDHIEVRCWRALPDDLRSRPRSPSPLGDRRHLPVLGSSNFR